MTGTTWKTAQKRRNARKLFFCCFAAVCFLLLNVPVNVQAANNTGLWISPTGAYTADAIGITEVKEAYYLFLPGNLDLNAYRIGFNSEALLLNGEQLQSGQTSASVLSAHSPNELMFVNGKKKKKIKLTLMAGDDLPAMYITTESGSLRKIHQDKKNKERGYMILSDTDGSQIYNGELKHIKMRGNASTRYNKKNYAIKLTQGANMFGMGKAKKWILLGNHLDKSLIRNQMTFDMARYAGLAYTPECRQVFVYINHEYMGLYLLTEKIEIDDDRVDIRNLEKETEIMNEKELNEYPITGKLNPKGGNSRGFQIPNEPEDISGGYIIEYDHDWHKYPDIPSGCVTKRGMCLIIHSPEYCSAAQTKYITGLMQSFENAIFAKDGKDPDTGKHYSDLVDFDSLVNKYLINEVSKNYDANMSSEYYYKPDDSVSEKVYAGPVWDLDNTYGDYARPDTQQNLKPTGLYVSKKGTLSFWWPALYRQPDFYRAVVNRYHEKFVPALEILLGLREEDKQLKSLDTYAAAIEKSAAMEYVRYPSLKQKQNQVQTGSSLQENIEYLRDYITKRMAFLSGEWAQE